MRSACATAALAAVLTLAVPGGASAWTRPEIEAAVASMQLDDLKACLAEFGQALRQTVTPQDINGDGVDELIVASSGSNTACFSMIAQQLHLLISDGRGGWQQHFGYDTHAFDVQPRPHGGWPDIALTGRGFCFPLYRWRDGEYFLWRQCQDGRLVTYTGEPFGSLKATLPPAGAPVEPIRVAASTEAAAMPAPDTGPEVVDPRSLDGIPYLHNSSVVLVDGARGLIVYLEPKPSLAGVARPGTVLFRGAPWNMEDTEGATIKGRAYMFKAGCRPAGYDVLGHYDARYGFSQFRLEGASPVRAKGGCAVVGASMTGRNATLDFKIAWD